jgi:hypothetical protein
MIPAIDPRDDARKRRGQIIGTVSAVTIVAAAALSGTRFRDWATWLLATEIIVVTAITVVADRSRRGGVRARDNRPRDGRKNGGNSAISAHDQREAGPVAPPAARRQRRLLITVSRMMPTPSGQRWLAEAESLLSEIAPARRAAAARSYLRSAPRLIMMMWAHEALRLARLGPRRPG